MIKLTNIWKDGNITLNTKISVVNTLVFLFFHYSAKTWMIRFSDLEQINVFEMCV